MPIASQHTRMPYEEWDLLPYQPGWKYEYWDGCAHITPNHQTAVTAVEVTPRSVYAPCALRPVSLEDETPLLLIYLEAFADNQAFCDYTEARFHEAARKDLHDSFRGRRAPLLAASRVAVDTGEGESQLIGAALLSRDESYGPVLDLIFVAPRWQKRGVATALAAQASNALAQEGERTLTSTYQLANVTSQAWHRAFGFVELPDLQYARAYYRRTRQELHRFETRRDLVAEDRESLVAEVQYWRGQIEALERLAKERGFEAVYPQRPHW
jgi:putative acetyltransferase